MMVTLGVILAALAVLFALTTLALRAAGRVRHVTLISAGLAVTLGVGLALLVE
jgi:hypothetical protein